MHSEVESKFQREFKWSLLGSILYESVKTIHCFLLLYFLDPVVFGKVGSIFSSVYLAIRIADFGMTYSLTPFLQDSIRSRKNFYHFLVRMTLLPHSIPLVAVAVGTTLWYRAHFSPPYTFILPIMIVLETVRSFIRMLLHNLFKSRITVIIELIIFFSYIGFIWFAFLVLGRPLTLNLVFLPHLADSALCMIAFAGLLYRFYCSLPIGDELAEHSISWWRLFSTRFFNYLLRINRNMFTSNFLTPFFALVYNLETAGIFYFASSIANALYAIVRTMVTFAGGGLLANLKQESLSMKKRAFSLLSDKVLNLIVPLSVVILVNYHVIVGLKSSDHTATLTISLSLLYLIIMLLESLFVLYEQFYLLEEMMQRLFFFKLFELTFFYGILYLGLVQYFSLVSSLLVIVSIRIINLAVIAIDAYGLWGIHFGLHLRKALVAGSFLFSLSLLALSKLFL